MVEAFSFFKKHYKQSKEDLNDRIYEIAIQNFLDVKLTTSCVILMQLLEREPSMLKIDIATEKRIF